MVMSRLRIPSFEELLKKVRQPKVPSVSATITPQDTTGAIPQGLTLPTGWKAQPDPIKGLSFVSPAGNTFTNIKLSPDGKIADLSGALVNGKPVKIPPLPPPGSIKPVSAAVTPEQVLSQPLPRPPVQPPTQPPFPEPILPPEPKLPESRAKDLWDAFRLSTAIAGEDIKNLFETTLPQFLLLQPPGLKTPTAASGMTATAREIAFPTERKSKEDIQQEMVALQQKFEQNKLKFNAFLTEHPELQPRPEWAGSFKEGMKKDPWGYIGYQIASTAPSVLTGLAAGVLGTVASGGNPLLGAAAAAAALTPQVTQQLFEDLKSSGATQEQALTLSAIIGPIIGGVEMAGALPILKALSPGIMRVFRKEIAQETVKLTLSQIARKGIVTATKVELAETAEEVLQQAIQNSTVKVVDENRAIGQGLGETAINAALATLPLSLFGGVASVNEAARGRFKVEIPKVWQTEVSKAQSSGLSQQEAERVAAARIMAMPEGRSITAEIIRSLTGQVPGTAQAISGIEMRLGKQSGDQIAKALGIRFDGIQKGTANIPDKLQFTDPVTGSTTYGNTLEEVKTNIENMRAKFESAKTPQEVPELHQALIQDGEQLVAKVQREEFQQRLIAAQDLSKEASEQKYLIRPNGDGSVTIYHGTSSINAQKITTEGKIERQSFFSPNKSGAEYYGKVKTKSGEIVAIKVDARDIEYSTGTGEIFAPDGLVRDEDNIWKSPKRLGQTNPDVIKFKGFLEQAKKPIMSFEQFMNWDFKVPEGGGSKTPKAVFSWAKDEYETLYEVSQQKDKFRFEEMLGKGWEREWKASLYLRDKIRKNEPIKIYRVSEEGEIIPGAYVSESLEYVQKHQENIMGGKGKIFSLEVTPDELMTYGDPHEFIYIPKDPKAEYQRLVGKGVISSTAAQRAALRGMEGLEAQVRASSGMAPSTSVQTGLVGFGKEAAQAQMFGEVSGKEGRKVPLAEVPKKEIEPLPGQIGLEETEAFRVSEEAAAKREVLREDPVAGYRFKMAGRNVGLDSLISIKEQSFPETLTVKQAQALNPEKSFAKYTVKGTKFYNKVPKDAALDQLTKEFNMTPDEIANRVMEIRAERRAIRQAPLTPAAEPTPEEKARAVTFGEAKVFSEKQKAQLLRLIGEYLENPNTDTAWELTMELRRETRAGQAIRLNERTQELLAEGVATEAAMTQAKREIMTGELPKVRTDFFDDVTDTMRVVLFDKVYQVLKDEPFERLSTQDALTNALAGRPIPREPGVKGGSAFTRLQRVFGKETPVLKAIEKMAEEKKPLRDVVEGIFREVDSWQAPMPIDQESADYLRALATKPMGQPRLGEESNIPRVKETRTPEEQRISELRLLINLASTASPNQAGYINLLLLEKDIPDILKLDYAKAINSIKNPGGQARELLIFGPTGKLGLNLQAEQMGLSQEQFADILSIPERRSLATMLLDYRRKNLMSDEELLKRVKDIDWETLSTDESLKLQRELWIAKGRPGPMRPEFMDKSVWDTFKEKGMPGFNFGEKKMIVGVLQEIGMSPIDIGNFLRANMSSVDFSFFRTGRMLGSGHPVAFYKALLSGWKATWSQKEADAHRRAITLDPDYELYERIRKDSGYDPLRVPAKEQEAAFRKSEEFGFPTEERFIPRMGQKLPHIKLSQRGFETALNDLVWDVWKQKLAMARRYAMKIASGKIKLKPGEAWDITKEMTDHQRMLGDMVQRASLNINVGKVRADFTPASPAFGGLLFAPRAKWARLIVGRHLFSANPRVRAEAWKDISAWVASTAGIVLLGAMLGLWEVETDSVSGEFVSIRIGKVRIDPWEGHRQIVNLYARLITGRTKSTITGKKRPTDIMDTFASFIRSSLNVLPGLITDIKMGKTFTGEKTDITNLEQTARRVLPFSLSQIWEVFQENWRIGLATLPFSVLGESISAYDTAESVSAEAIAKLGKVDIEAREEKVQKAKEAGFTPVRIAEIMADDKAYDMSKLRSDINSSTSKGSKASPIVADYWTFKEQDDKYAKMSTKEQEDYLKDNPGYVTDRLFWGETTEIPDLPTANKLVARVEKYGFNLDVIPAFQKTDKTFKIEGKEVKRQVDRIPSDRNLWPDYFDYKNLPEDTTQTARNKYLNDNPDIEAFLVVNTDRTTISSLAAAQKAANSGVPFDQIVAFSLTDKGKERIPTDKTLRQSFFDYNDLPSSSYLAMTQAQVDAGMLPDKYLKEWETYHKLKTDTAKDFFRKDHKEVSKGDWRDDFRRANPEFDKWLQENLDMKPLPVKKLARRGGASIPRPAAISGGVSFGSARPRRGKPSYPKFKKPRIKVGMSVGAPRAPGI